MRIAFEHLNVFVDDVARSRLQVADRFCFTKMNSEQKGRYDGVVSVEVKNGTGPSIHAVDTFSRFKGRKSHSNTGTHILGKGSN